MARFLFNIGVVVVCLGAVSVLAQAGRPASPTPRAVPFHTVTPPNSPPAVPAATPTPIAGDVQQSQRTNVTTPAAPPVVTYRDGLLTVQATNSSLSSVVTAIRNKTGIEFEGMENVSERVALSLGPAPEGEVLSALFSGPKYDFVAIGRPDSPGIVQRVIVTLKNKGGDGTQAQQQPRPAGQDADSEDDTPDEQVNSGGDPQDTPVQQPPAPGQQLHKLSNNSNSSRSRPSSYCRNCRRCRSKKRLRRRPEYQSGAAEAATTLDLE